jgi:hypothetical protein
LQVNEAEHRHKNLWLLKPTGFNRGIGIHVFNSPSDLKNILWSHYRIEAFQTSMPLPHPSRPQQSEGQTEGENNELSLNNTSFIVQKYIEAPVLFRNRKFDLRLWVLIGHDGMYYMFKEGYVRTSSEIYNLEDSQLD